MSQKKDREPEQHHAAEGAVRAYARSKTFIDEIMRENERLRYKVFHLQQELATRSPGAAAGAPDVVSENQRLRRQLEEIKSQFEALNKENEDFRNRYQEVERQNESLLNLYVSGYQLHSTLADEAVLSIIREILLNLVGAEVFAIWLLDPQTGGMELANVTDECGLLEGRAVGLPAERWAQLRAGEPWFAEEPSSVPAGEPVSCIALKLEERPVGVLGIFKLLEQKQGGFTALDQELLGLLAAQAAATLIGARTFTQSGAVLEWTGDGAGPAG